MNMHWHKKWMFTSLIVLSLKPISSSTSGVGPTRPRKKGCHQPPLIYSKLPLWSKNLECFSLTKFPILLKLKLKICHIHWRIGKSSWRVALGRSPDNHDIWQKVCFHWLRISWEASAFPLYLIFYRITICRIETCIDANLFFSGLGEVICLQFAQAGSNVAINYMSSEDRAKALRSKIEREHGVKAFLIQGVAA
jgi:hypothetical protein